MEDFLENRSFDRSACCLIQKVVNHEFRRGLAQKLMQSFEITNTIKKSSYF